MFGWDEHVQVNEKKVERAVEAVKKEGKKVTSKDVYEAYRKLGGHVPPEMVPSFEDAPKKAAKATKAEKAE